MATRSAYLTDPDNVATVYQAIKLAQAIAAAVVATDPTLVDRRGVVDGGPEKLASAISAALGYLDFEEPNMAMYAAVARFAVRKYTSE